MAIGAQLLPVRGGCRRRPAVEYCGGAGAQRDQRRSGDAVCGHRPGRAGLVFQRQQPPEPPAGEQVAREATLYGLYVQALAALRTDRHEQAITLLDSLLTLDPTYRDAAARRDAARQAHRLATGYQRAQAAEGAGDWTAAARYYAEI